MRPSFDHERLKAYQSVIQFVVWVGPLIDELPARLAARDQLDRASTSIASNLAEGNGKRSYAERSRFFDIARGSGVECAACLDVLVAQGKLDAARAENGKGILIEVVSMTAGLIARFSTAGAAAVQDDAGVYVASHVAGEND